MITDAQLQFSNAQAITASAASTNDIVLATVANTNGAAPGNPLWAYVRVGTAFNNLTSLTIALRTSDDGFSTSVDVASIVVPLASLSAGAEFAVALSTGLKKKVRLYYTVTGTAPTQGTVSGWLVSEVPAKNVFTYTA